jgi:hypothetical protein
LSGGELDIDLARVELVAASGADDLGVGKAPARAVTQAQPEP